MKKVYILLTRSQTLVSRIVYSVTKAKYTHVALGFDENLDHLYSSSRKNGVTMFPAGPCKERIRYGNFVTQSSMPCVLYEMNVSEESYKLAWEHADSIIDKADDYHYNIIGLGLCLFHIKWERKKHFLCSQFVAQVLSESGAYELPKHHTLMRPIDFYELPNTKILYEGTIKELVEQLNDTRQTA